MTGFISIARLEWHLPLRNRHRHKLSRANGPIGRSLEGAAATHASIV